MGYSLTEPLSKGWQEMQRQLFQPFDLGRWMTLGFSAWLATLIDSCGTGGSLNPGGSGDFSDLKSDTASWPEPEEIWEQTQPMLARAMNWLTEYWWVPLAVGVSISIILVVWLVLLWISSRGKLIFVDNVVHNRAEVIAPWKHLRDLGNSLLVFRLLFALISTGVGILVISGCIYFFYAGFTTGNWGSPLLLTLGVSLGLTIPALIVTSAYISFFLNAFVVPIMHRHQIRVGAAWSHFFAIFKQNVLAFLAAGLLVALLFFTVGIIIVVFGFSTCCVGFLILAIPYLGTVFLLPLLVTYRAFTVEFLAQFDPDLSFPPRDLPPLPEALEEAAA